MSRGVPYANPVPARSCSVKGSVYPPNRGVALTVAARTFGLCYAGFVGSFEQAGLDPVWPRSGLGLDPVCTFPEHRSTGTREEAA